MVFETRGFAIDSNPFTRVDEVVLESPNQEFQKALLKLSDMARKELERRNSAVDSKHIKRRQRHWVLPTANVQQPRRPLQRLNAEHVLDIHVESGVEAASRALATEIVIVGTTLGRRPDSVHRWKSQLAFDSFNVRCNAISPKQEVHLCVWNVSKDSRELLQLNPVQSRSDKMEWISFEDFLNDMQPGCRLHELTRFGDMGQWKDALQSSCSHHQLTSIAIPAQLTAVVQTAKVETEPRSLSLPRSSRSQEGEPEIQNINQGKSFTEILREEHLRRKRRLPRQPEAKTLYAAERARRRRRRERKSLKMQRMRRRHRRSDMYQLPQLVPSNRHR